MASHQLATGTAFGTVVGDDMEYPILVVPENFRMTTNHARRARRFGCAFKSGARCVQNGPPGLSQLALQSNTPEAQLTWRLEPLLTVTAVSCSLLSSIAPPCRRKLRDPESPDALPVHTDDKNSKKGAIQEVRKDEKEENDIEGILNFTAAIQQQKLQTVWILKMTGQHSYFTGLVRLLHLRCQACMTLKDNLMIHYCAQCFLSAKVVTC